MKVPRSIRQIYDDQVDLNNRLKDEIDRRFISLKQLRWHYESRVKNLQSFALKVETGRFADPSKLEDFFACTLVVTNTLEIESAEQLVREQFKLHDRRPSRSDYTHKSSYSFPFDDLRLYVSLKQDPALPENFLAGVVFEVQLKTFLQHAWSIATHDLVYKSDDANWSTERIAYQIKAMLEHAELSIQEAERLSESPALKKEDQLTANIRKSIALLKAHWSADQLPEDIRRLALNITNLIGALGLRQDRLNKILSVVKGHAGGTLPLNLSPYGVIVQALLHEEKDTIMELLVDPQARMKIVIPAEVEFPDDINRDTCRSAIFLK